MSVGRWRTYPGNDGYEVSDLGIVRVRTKRGRSSRVGRVLKPWLHKGYPMVALFPGRVKVFVHIMVLETFEGPCPLGWCTNHKDGVKTNPRLRNLEWATYGDNNQHAYDTGLKRKGGCHPQAKVSDEGLREICNRLQAGDKQKDIAADFGVDPSLISHVKRGVQRRNQCL